MFAELEARFSGFLPPADFMEIVNLIQSNEK
jgi:hypothetical protein